MVKPKPNKIRSTMLPTESMSALSVIITSTECFFLLHEVLAFLASKSNCMLKRCDADYLYQPIPLAKILVEENRVGSAGHNFVMWEKCSAIS